MKSLITHLNFSSLTKVSSTAVSSKLVLAGFALILAGCPAKEETGGRIFDSVDGQAVPDAGEEFARAQAAADAESKRKIEEGIASGALSREQQFELEKLDREINSKKAETEAQTANLRGAKDEANAKEKTKQVYKEQDTKLLTSLAATGVDAAKALGDYKNGKDEAQAAKDRSAADLRRADAYADRQAAAIETAKQDANNTREKNQNDFVLGLYEHQGERAAQTLEQGVVNARQAVEIAEANESRFNDNLRIMRAAKDGANLSERDADRLRELIGNSLGDQVPVTVPTTIRVGNDLVPATVPSDEAKVWATATVEAVTTPGEGGAPAPVDLFRLDREEAQSQFARAVAWRDKLPSDDSSGLAQKPQRNPDAFFGTSFPAQSSGDNSDETDQETDSTMDQRPKGLISLSELIDAQNEVESAETALNEKKKSLVGAADESPDTDRQTTGEIANLERELEQAKLRLASLFSPGLGEDGSHSVVDSSPGSEAFQLKMEIGRLEKEIQEASPKPSVDPKEILDDLNPIVEESIPAGETSPVATAGGPAATASVTVSQAAPVVMPILPTTKSTSSSANQVPSAFGASNSVEDIQAALAAATVSGDEAQAEELQSLLDNPGVSNLSGGNLYGGIFEDYQNATLSCTKREVASECDSLVPQVDSNFDKARSALASLRGDSGPMSDATRAQALSDLVAAQNALRAVASRFAELSDEATNSVSKIQYANSYSVINSIASDLGKAVSAYQAGETYNSSQLEAILTARYDDLEYRHGEVEGVSLHTPQSSEDSSTAYAQGDQAIINALHSGGFDAFAAEVDRQKNLRDN